jgi:hypothetical protein
MPAAGCRSAARAVTRAPSTGSLLLVRCGQHAGVTRIGVIQQPDGSCWEAHTVAMAPFWVRHEHLDREADHELHGNRSTRGRVLSRLGALGPDDSYGDEAAASGEAQ